MANVKLAGFDIGGTKCAAIIGSADETGKIVIEKRREIPTPKGVSPFAVLDALCDSVAGDIGGCRALGISCGGPLDSQKGLILSPPNLVGWDNVPVVAYLKEKLRLPCALQNDANACALAEWRFGAGRGFRNIVFCTCGSGFGAGLILDGKLYTGANDNAGEIGHVRLSDDGPVGYGKRGSVEGYCSGNGIAQIGRTLALERIQAGNRVSYCIENDLSTVTAKSIAVAAENGDKTAIEVYDIAAKKLGLTCAMLMDILNPERIIIGSVFARSERLFRKVLDETVAREALPFTAAVCRIVPAQLGDAIGDYAALAVAVDHLNGLFTE